MPWSVKLLTAAILPAAVAYEIVRWVLQPQSANLCPGEPIPLRRRHRVRTAVAIAPHKSLDGGHVTAAILPDSRSPEPMPEPSLPESRGAVMELVRKFDIKIQKIESFEQPQLVRTEDGVIEMQAHVYALGAPKLESSSKIMRQEAFTVVFRYIDEQVTVRKVEGWVVPEPWIPQEPVAA